MRCVLLVVILSSFLVYAKADKEEAAFVEDFDENTAEEETPDAEDPRSILPTKRPLLIRRRVPVPLYLYPPTNSVFFRQCYCFRRLCYVSGLYPRYLGWQVRYKSGYVVYGNYLYRFYQCPYIPWKPTPKRGDETL